MEFDQALEQTRTLALARQDYTLSEVDKLILTGTWSGLTYDEMANTSDYSLNYLMRDVAPRLWKLLSKVYGERVSKSNYRAVCDRYAEPETPQSVPVTPAVLTSSPATVLDKPDWGDAPDVPDSGFFGRVKELAELENWLLNEAGGDRCRLVTLWGLPGIGKTSLARRLADQVKDDFEFVVWRSLYRKPLLKDLAQDILPRLGVTVVPGQEITQFIEIFQQSRCLVILDGLESLLRDKDSWGFYREGYEDYDDFFKRIAETPHRSCLLLTSREKPKKLSLLAYPSQPVYFQELNGLTSEVAKHFFDAYGLKDEQSWQELFERYSGNPTITKQIATLSRDIFAGYVSSITELSTLLVKENYQHEFKSIVDRLTEDEKLLLKKIANSQLESVGLGTSTQFFKEMNGDEPDAIRALQSIESLKSKSLLKMSQPSTKTASVTPRFQLPEFIKKLLHSSP
ncbi:MAG: AAA family ATPase [Cyanobacteria bacterium P01_G01_bin.54]